MIRSGFQRVITSDFLNFHKLLHVSGLRGTSSVHVLCRRMDHEDLSKTTLLHRLLALS